MEVKDVGQLRKIIENISDDYEIEMRVRRRNITNHAGFILFLRKCVRKPVVVNGILRRLFPM